ncbi:MAG: hypothetical protein ACP5PJ_10610 [Acidimicrobiales bacterium]
MGYVNDHFTTQLCGNYWDTNSSCPLASSSNRERIVAAMEDRREWDVTVRPRVEGVTDREAFPDMWRSELATETGLSHLYVNHQTVPHSTSVVVRVAATAKKDAERQVQEFALHALLRVARDLVGEQAFGWTLRIDAVPSRALPEHR